MARFDVQRLQALLTTTESNLINGGTPNQQSKCNATHRKYDYREVWIAVLHCSALKAEVVLELQRALESESS